MGLVFFFPLVFLTIGSERKNLRVDQVRKSRHVKMCLSTGKGKGREGDTTPESFILMEDQAKDTALLKNANCKNPAIRRCVVA